MGMDTEEITRMWKRADEEAEFLHPKPKMDAGTTAIFGFLISLGVLGLFRMLAQLPERKYAVAFGITITVFTAVPYAYLKFQDIMHRRTRTNLYWQMLQDAKKREAATGARDGG
jgi:hypothetical protein